MSNGLTVPEKKDFYVTEQTKKALDAVVALSAETPQNILVKGMQGCGKTELGAQLAARLNRPFTQFQVGLLNEPGQLFGQQILRNSNVEYQQFLFTDAIQVENAFILLDELNRAQHPKALNDLYSVLDERRHIWLDELHTSINVAEGVIFFATLNEGADFTGTDIVDKALLDRFPYVLELSTLPIEVESGLLQNRIGMAAEAATKLASVFYRIRGDQDLQLSTRKALATANLIKQGMNLREAFCPTMSIDRDHLEKVLIAVHMETEIEMQEEKLSWTLL